MRSPSASRDGEDVGQPTRVDVCVCTYRRPQLAAAARSVFAQRLPRGVRLRLIVADNDDEPSAAPLVEALAAAAPFPVRYLHAPARNISLARNACLDAADADWLAFLDDDETAAQNWIDRLLARARAERLDAVFGPAIAVYPPETPRWIREGDYHTNRQELRHGEVQTGYTCNALVRWTRPETRALRFRLEKGRTGGEDTDFFYRLWRSGGRMGLADDARVFDKVDPKRLTAAWLRRRKFNAGLAYGDHLRFSEGPTARARGLVSALGKVLVCATAALAFLPDRRRRMFWALRGVMHAGVCAGLLRLRAPERY